MRRAAVSAGWRWRRQLVPLWHLAGAWVAALLSRATVPGWPGLGLAFGAAALAWVVMVRRSPRLRRPALAAYLAVTLLLEAAITGAGAVAGPASRAEGTMLLLGVLVALPWWYRHRPVYGDAPEHEPEEVPGEDPATAFAEEADKAWHQYVAAPGGPLAGAVPRPPCDEGHPRLDGDQLAALAGLGTLGAWAPVDGGISADLQLKRGQMTATQAVATTERVASALGEAPHDVALEKHPTSRGDLARITLFESNPLYVPRMWPGPSLDIETGEIRIGLYATGGYALFRPYAPKGNGHAGGALHSLISGTSGAGKSQFLLQLGLEYMRSGVMVVWPCDPQMGASMPELIAHCPRSAVSVEETMDRLREAYAIAQAVAAWMGKNGVKTVMPQDMPQLRLIIDEAHMVLKHEKYGKEAVQILADIGKLGRKCGVGVDLVTQVPLLEELGNSEVLRSMLQGGNVVVFRTAGKMSGQLAFQGAFAVDPSSIPKVFPGGTGSAGACYLFGGEAREALARTWQMAMTDEESMQMAAEAAPYQARLNDIQASAIGGDGATAPVLWTPASGAGGTAAVVPAVAVAQPAPGPSGRPQSFTCADAVTEGLRRAGRPLGRAEAWDAANAVATGDWERAEQYSMRTVGDALASLLRAGTITQGGGEKSPYALAGSSAPRPGDEQLGKLAAALTPLVIGMETVRPADLTALLGIGEGVTAQVLAAMEALGTVGPAGPDGSRPVRVRLADIVAAASGPEGK